MTLILFNLLFFTIALIFDYLNRSNYLGETIKEFYLKFTLKSFIIIYLVVFVINIVLFILLGYFEISFLKVENFDASCFELSKTVTGPQPLAGGPIDIDRLNIQNTPNSNIHIYIQNLLNSKIYIRIPLTQSHVLSISIYNINYLIALVTSTWGFSLGLKFSNYASEFSLLIPGSPKVKAIATIGIAIILCILTFIISIFIEDSNNYYEFIKTITVSNLDFFKKFNFIELLNFLGIPLENSPPVEILLAGYYFVMSIFILINVINIIVYLLTIYIVTNEKILNRIPSEYVHIHKLIRFYKNIRVGYIIFEAILLIYFLIMMIIFSYGIIALYLFK